MASSRFLILLGAALFLAGVRPGVAGGTEGGAWSGRCTRAGPPEQGDATLCEIRLVQPYETRYGAPAELGLTVRRGASGHVVVVRAEAARYAAAFVAIDNRGDILSRLCGHGACAFAGAMADRIVNGFFEGMSAIVGLVTTRHMTIVEETVTLVGFTDAYRAIFEPPPEGAPVAVLKGIRPKLKPD